MSAPVRIPTTLDMVAGAQARFLEHVSGCPSCTLDDPCAIGRTRLRRFRALGAAWREEAGLAALPAPLFDPDAPGRGRIAA